MAQRNKLIIIAVVLAALLLLCVLAVCMNDELAPWGKGDETYQPTDSTPTESKPTESTKPTGGQVSGGVIDFDDMLNGANKN